MWWLMMWLEARVPTRVYLKVSLVEVKHSELLGDPQFIQWCWLNRICPFLWPPVWKRGESANSALNVVSPHCWLTSLSVWGPEWLSVLFFFFMLLLHVWCETWALLVCRMSSFRNAGRWRLIHGQVRTRFRPHKSVNPPHHPHETVFCFYSWMMVI